MLEIQVEPSACVGVINTNTINIFKTQQYFSSLLCAMLHRFERALSVSDVLSFPSFSVKTTDNLHVLMHSSNRVYSWVLRPANAIYIKGY